MMQLPKDSVAFWTHRQLKKSQFWAGEQESVSGLHNWPPFKKLKFACVFCGMNVTYPTVLSSASFSWKQPQSLHNKTGHDRNAMSAISSRSLLRDIRPMSGLVNYRFKRYLASSIDREITSFKRSILTPFLCVQMSRNNNIALC